MLNVFRSTTRHNSLDNQSECDFTQCRVYRLIDISIRNIVFWQSLNCLLNLVIFNSWRLTVNLLWFSNLEFVEWLMYLINFSRNSLQRHWTDSRMLLSFIFCKMKSRTSDVLISVISVFFRMSKMFWIWERRCFESAMMFDAFISSSTTLYTILILCHARVAMTITLAAKLISFMIADNSSDNESTISAWSEMIWLSSFYLEKMMFWSHDWSRACLLHLIRIVIVSLQQIDRKMFRLQTLQYQITHKLSQCDRFDTILHV